MHKCEMSARGKVNHEQEISPKPSWSDLSQLPHELILSYALGQVRDTTGFENLALAFLKNKEFFIENGPAGVTEPAPWARMIFRHRRVHTPKISCEGMTGALVPHKRADLVLLWMTEDEKITLDTWKVQWTNDRWKCTKPLARFQINGLCCSFDVTSDATIGLGTVRKASTTELYVFRPLNGAFMRQINLNYPCSSDPNPILSTFGSHVAVLLRSMKGNNKIEVFDTASGALLRTRDVQHWPNFERTAFVEYESTLHWHNDVTLRWLAVEKTPDGTWTGNLGLYTWRVDNDTEAEFVSQCVATGEGLSFSVFKNLVHFSSDGAYVVFYYISATQVNKCCMLQIDPVLRIVDVTSPEDESPLWNPPLRRLRSFQAPYAVSWPHPSVLDIVQIRPRCLDKDATVNSHPI